MPPSTADQTAPGNANAEKAALTALAQPAARAVHDYLLAASAYAGPAGVAVARDTIAEDVLAWEVPEPARAAEMLHERRPDVAWKLLGPGPGKVYRFVEPGRPGFFARLFGRR